MRKRRCVRCVLGILLSVCMIFGMVWLPEGSQAEASNDTMEVTFYKTGRWQSVSGTRIVTESDLSTYAGYCKATVLLDGKEQLVDWQIAQAPEPTKGNENRWSLVSRQDTGNGIPSGTKSLIIPKETVFYKTDGTPILQAGEDFALTYAGNYTDWPEGFTDAAFTMRWIGDQENGDTYVALNVDKNICDLSTVYSSGDKFSSTVLVNGEERAVTWQYIYDGTNQLIRSDYSVDSVNYIPSDATEIEIAEGAFLISATGTKKPIRITKGIVLTEVGGSWVEGCMNMGLAFAAVYPQTDFLQVQFTYDADLSKIAESTCYVYLDTEIDGEIVKNVRWVINKSVGKIYPDGTAPTVPATAKSVKIHAGIYSGGYSGTSCTAPIRITNDVGAVYVSGAWQDALAVRSVNASYYEVVGMSNQTPQIKLTVDVVTTDEWKGWFNGKAYVGDQEVNARFYFEPNTQTLLVGQNVGDSDPSDNVMKALKDHKTVKIKAQGELSPVQGQPGSIVLNLAEDLTLSWNGSEYVEGIPEITTNISYRGLITDETAYSLHLTVDNYDDLVTEYGLWSWLEGTIKVNGTDRTVAFQLGSNVLATLPTSQNANAGLPLDTTSIEIPAGTIFTDADGSSENPLKIANRFFYVKVGAVWTTYTSEYEYPEGNNILYYNIDNGSSYTLTSSNGAIEVKELPDLVAGDTISKVGTYNITRVENSVLYKEKVVLYKHGDADENDEIDVRDLVAMKWAIDGNNEEQNARLAGMYAADIDRSGAVDDVDLTALRRALVSEDPAAALSVSKGNSVLNGVMPIAGFSTPVEETYITDSIYQMIADTGINMIAYCGNDYNNSTSQTLAEKQLRLAEKYNLKMYVTDGSVPKQTATDMPAKIGRYSMYHSFLGLHIVDEPEYGDVYVNSNFDRPIAVYTNAINLYNGSANINGYVNLFPYYSDITNATTANYKEYLTNTFTNTGAEILSYDHYAIRAGANSWFQSWITGEDFKKTVKAGDFYKNLEMVRAQVEGTGKPFWAYAQTGYPITASGTVGDSVRVTAAEQQWEINAALAMGAKGVQYYQLFQGTDYAGSDNDYRRSGLIGANGQANTIYYNAAKELNAFIAVIDEVLMNAENKGVIVKDSIASGALGSDVKLSSYKELESVTGTNAMVGCFDYYGKTALLVVNCNTSSAQDITLNFTESCKAAVTKIGDTAVNRTAAGAASVTINVGAGQSALVIIE